MSIEEIDFNLLKVLRVVLDERSVVRAARRLHVTPSAVSNALARLRELLGDPLVTRHGRGIVPTPRALELDVALERGLREIELAISAAPFDPARCARRFTLAIADAGQLAFLPRIADRMSAEMPMATLRVVGIDSLVALGDLSSPEIDLHVGVAARGVGLHEEVLYRERLVLTVAKRDRARARPLSLRALEALRHVAVELAPGRGFPDAVEGAYARAGVHRAVALTAPTFAAAAAIVAATDLVATLPESLVSALGERLGVRTAAGPIPEHAVDIAMGWHERTHADPASVAFRSVVRRSIARSERAGSRRRS